MRGLIDRKGEQIGYFVGDKLYTMDGEYTGRLEGEYIVNLAGERVWRVVGQGVYSLDQSETIGYISGAPLEHDD
ncbi:MAG: hypothetical protein D6706_20735 [Chloroflexi bacterium]|nr:MAG: hypothetical protein D6706_20735 [Chloroflexota bacterium]